MCSMPNVNHLHLLNVNLAVQFCKNIMTVAVTAACFEQFESHC